MEWDLGFRGVALLLGMSLGFGLAANVAMWRVTTHWLWLIAAAACFVIGVFVSEVWFGWATEEDLQPNIDGLSFDEALLSGIMTALLVMLVAWMVARRGGVRPPDVLVR